MVCVNSRVCEPYVNSAIIEKEQRQGAEEKRCREPLALFIMTADFSVCMCKAQMFVCAFVV